jgi:hypothetical protein
MEWVIDTQVLVDADKNDNSHGHLLNVTHLLDSMIRFGHFLAVDTEGRIEDQYRKQRLNPNGYVQVVLRHLVSRGRLIHYAGQLTNNVRLGLRSLSFDKDDDVFVGVAARISGGKLVAEESDYTLKVIQFLSDHEIHVMDCAAAGVEIDAIGSPE